VLLAAMIGAMEIVVRVADGTGHPGAPVLR
jgi:hypothetical protein